MKEKWIIQAKKADFQGLGEKLGIDQVLARIIRNRDLVTEEEMRAYLYAGRESLYDPYLLKDVKKAAEIILQKIREGKRIRIIGDYDIDGIMATYILLSGLTRLQAVVDTCIPDRIADGYGLNEHLVQKAAAEGVDTILTCDNGISAIAQITLAKELGMTVVVTDHHELPYEEIDGQRKELLPSADAIINPKQSDCSYPFKKLCGAAVAYKFICVLYDLAGLPMSEADCFIEQAGFATIGDVMDLQGENRILVKEGLQMLNQTSNLGMKALIMQNGLQLGSIQASHIGFRLGPCLNASGRLENAQMSLQLLMCQREVDASVMAMQLTELNESRKSMTAHAVNMAMQQIEEKGYEEDKILVIYLPDCHESLAGIVAGRIREAYYRPCLVITKGEECAKGSARSIDAYSMFDELTRVKELFIKYGGHPLAAGFSLQESNIDLLRKRLNEMTNLTEADLIPKISIDVPMPIDYIYEDLVEKLSILEPFGKSNEKPVFADKNLTIESLRILGKEGRVLRMNLRSSYGRKMEAVYFGDPQKLKECISEKYGDIAAEDTICGRCIHEVSLHFIYYPKINEYQGRRSLQLIISGFCS